MTLSRPETKELPPDLLLRLARVDDVAALEELIPLSVRGLQAPYYSTAQIEAALGSCFGVDRVLIQDGTYFVIEAAGRIIAAGGWSRRRSLYGGDAGRGAEEDTELDPKSDAARIRAFYVHPDWARRGLGRKILEACEQAIRDAGFTRVEIVATLPGEPLYAAFGYRSVAPEEIPIAHSLKLPVVRMVKEFR